MVFGLCGDFQVVELSGWVVWGVLFEGGMGYCFWGYFCVGVKVGSSPVEFAYMRSLAYICVLKYSDYGLFGIKGLS